MSRYLSLLLVGLLIGGASGFALGIFVYPYVFLADIVAKEEVVEEAHRTLITTGQFTHANPSDPIHWGKGGVKVYKDLVYLEMDFEVGPGPAFHVYLVPEAVVTPDTAVDKTMYVDLGSLRAFKGGQNYPVPKGVDVKNYPYVVIWCERFGVLISPAKLQQTPAPSAPQ